MPRREILEKIYFHIIEWGTCLILFTPFIFVRDYFFPFVVPKTIFFRVLVDIIFIPYILLAISNPKYRPRFNALTIGITVFLAILVLTSFTGISFERSFWSTFERMTGLLTFFHLYAFFIVLTNVFRERKYWERILAVSILVGILICFYIWTSTEAVTRGGGTLGNTSFFSAYIIFNIFFALILLITKKSWWKIIYGASLIILLYTLFVNQEPTQGAIGAFLGGIFVLTFSYLLYFLFSTGKKFHKITAIIIVFLLILGSIGILQLGPVKERISEIWQSGSMQSRLVVWNMGWQGWQERFWLGWGPENFNIPFAKYFDPELPLTQDIWYDRAHNIVLDVGVTSGIIGLLSYLSIFGVAIFKLASIIPKISEKRNVIFPFAMIALLLVYFAQNIWVFDMISSYMIFFLSLAFINFLISPPREEAEIILSKKNKTFWSLGGAILIILTILTFFFGNIQAARASRFIVRGLSFPLEQSLAYFKKALILSPMSQFEAPEQFSRRMISLASKQNQNQALLKEGIILAEEELEKSIKKNPLDFRLYLFLGKYYLNLYQVTGDAGYIPLADEYLNKSKELSSKNQQVYWSLSQLELYQGNREGAIEILQIAIDLEPRLPQSHWYLASVYRMDGQYEKALEEIQKAEQLGYNWQGNISDLKMEIEVYQALGVDTNTLIPLYEKGLALTPNDVKLLGNIADAYASVGEKEKAKAAAEKLLELKPDLKEQIEQFLRELGY